MNRLLKSLKWLDDNIIKILLIFFIFFIPLYPKLPLIDLEYTYIYIRFEDLFMVFITVVFFVQWLRKKISINQSFLTLFMLFWLAVMLSFLNGFYLTKTIPVSYLGFLHAVRRIEYMIVFFIAAASVKSIKDFYLYLKLILTVVVIVSLYGIGQKFLGWPAVQTMNPEYARGYLLYLTPEARISSTFAGHYDLASYIIFFIPLTLAYYFFRFKKYIFIVFLLSLISLVLTASRVSYVAYILSVLPFLIFLKKPKTLIVVVILTIGLTLLSNNLTSRLKRTFQVKRIFVDQKTGAVYVPQKITAKELPAGTFYLALKGQTAPVATNDAALLKQVLKEKTKGKIKSEAEIATLAANLKPINTVVSDISFATRLQVEWPRAIAAFKSSPLLGTGPSSLTEATDNDYLRWLGELGILGTSLFMIILLKIFLTIFKATKSKVYDPKSKYLFWGFLFGFFALMINASYIDVFEASKVAYTFWSTSGIFIGLTSIKNSKF